MCTRTCAPPKGQPGLVFLDRNQIPDDDIHAGDYTNDDDSD
jgi:hypothetical protein